MSVFSLTGLSSRLFTAAFKTVLRSKTQVRNMEVFTQVINPLTGLSEWDAKSEDYDLHQEIARSAFADMLHDTERNKKYYVALKAAINRMHDQNRKANVLDIGTGTGLLSIMAERCGADSITACEAFNPMAECAQKIMKLNNKNTKIKLIPKRSTEIVIGHDMESRANILVTEVFDTELIGEAALETFIHAHEHLLEKECIVVPQSATIFVQVVECPTMQKCNKINDLYDEDMHVFLRTPKPVRGCPGSAAVHDVQLSQLNPQSFNNLSLPLAVLEFDWSGKIPLLKHRKEIKEFNAIKSGKAQMVFMWWDLQMDTEGKVILSCAPWWNHPDADKSLKNPEDSIPWRDHWMQAIYYLPQEVTIKQNEAYKLISSHDAFSLWFDINNEINKRPICECGAHMIYSRTHVSYLNDGKRSKKVLASLSQTIKSDSVVLSFNGASFMGLAASKLNPKRVYIVEQKRMNLDLLRHYIEVNNLSNICFIEEKSITDVIAEVTDIICDPNFAESVLPWNNLKFAYLLYKNKERLQKNVNIIPKSCTIWAMPVQFLDLHKIRIPLGSCEEIDMSVFDALVENSRNISDDELEAQPLWEYPAFCLGAPIELLSIDFDNLDKTYYRNVFYSDWDESVLNKNVNGVAIWMNWSLTDKHEFICGPTVTPELNKRLTWDMHTRQAVKLFRKEKKIENGLRFNFSVKCDFDNESFNIKIVEE